MALESMEKTKAEAVATLDEFLEVFLGILLPIALALLGFFVVGPVVGLSGFFATFMSGSGVAPTWINAVSMGGAVAVEGALGFGLVGVERMYDGYVGDVVGAAGWMLVAMALRELVNWLMGNGPMAPSGPLSQLATRLSSGLTTAANGG